MKLLGADIHLSFTPTWAAEVEVEGVTVAVPPTAAALFKAALARTSAGAERVTKDAAAAVEAARVREAAALERAEAAERKAQELEAELLSARAGLAAAAAAALDADAQRRAAFDVLVAVPPVGRA